MLNKNRASIDTRSALTPKTNISKTANPRGGGIENDSTTYDNRMANIFSPTNSSRHTRIVVNDISSEISHGG